MKNKIQDLSHTNSNIYYERKAELTDLKTKLSKVEKEYTEISATLELELFDIGNQNFKTYYKKNLHDIARKMDKVYGPRPVNQFKGKHKRDITDSSHMLEHRKIRNYQAAVALLEESK